MIRYLALVLLAACGDKDADSDTDTDTDTTADTDTDTDTPAVVDPAAGAWSGTCSGHISVTYGTVDDPGYYEGDVLLDPVVLSLEVADGAVTGSLEGTQVFDDGGPNASFTAALEGTAMGADLAIQSVPVIDKDNTYEETVMLLDLVLSGDQLTGTLTTNLVDDPLACTFDRG